MHNNAREPRETTVLGDSSSYDLARVAHRYIARFALNEGHVLVAGLSLAFERATPKCHRVGRWRTYYDDLSNADAVTYLDRMTARLGADTLKTSGFIREVLLEFRFSTKAEVVDPQHTSHEVVLLLTDDEGRERMRLFGFEFYGTAANGGTLEQTENATFKRADETLGQAWKQLDFDHLADEVIRHLRFREPVMQP